MRGKPCADEDGDEALVDDLAELSVCGRLEREFWHYY